MPPPSRLSKLAKLRILTDAAAAARTAASPSPVTNRPERPYQSHHIQKPDHPIKNPDQHRSKDPLYKDPYLLTDSLAALVKANKPEEAFKSLVSQPRHVATNTVFSYFFTILAKHRQNEIAIDAYSEMRKRNLLPTSRGYTSLLQSIANHVQTLYFNKNTFRKFFHLACKVWEKSEKNLPQTNAMLCVCSACAIDESWTMAKSIFGTIVKNAPAGYALSFTLKNEAPVTDNAGLGPSDSDPLLDEPDSESKFDPNASSLLNSVVPDARTYTIMIGLCARITDQRGIDLGIDIWESALQRAALSAFAQDQPAPSKKKSPSKPSNKHDSGSPSQIEIGTLDAPFVIDPYLASSFLLLCTRSKDSQAAERALSTIPAVFGLPASPQESYNPTKPPAVKVSQVDQLDKKALLEIALNTTRLDVSTPVLTLLVHLASRLRYPALGRHWFDIATKRLGVQIDDGLAHATATLLLSSKQYESAWNIANDPSLTRKYSYQIGFRACALASVDSNASPEIWLARSKEMYQRGSAFAAHNKTANQTNPDAPLFGHREVLNCLMTAFASKDWIFAANIVLEQRDFLIDTPSSGLERLVERQARILNSTSEHPKNNTEPETDFDSGKDISSDISWETQDIAAKLTPIRSENRRPSEQIDPRLLRKGLELSIIALETFINNKLCDPRELVRAQLALSRARCGFSFVRMLRIQSLSSATDAPSGPANSDERHSGRQTNNMDRKSRKDRSKNNLAKHASRPQSLAVSPNELGYRKLKSGSS